MRHSRKTALHRFLLLYFILLRRSRKTGAPTMPTAHKKGAARRENEQSHLMRYVSAPFRAAESKLCRREILPAVMFLGG